MNVPYSEATRSLIRFVVARYYLLMSQFSCFLSALALEFGAAEEGRSNRGVGISTSTDVFNRQGGGVWAESAGDMWARTGFGQCLRDAESHGGKIPSQDATKGTMRERGQRWTTCQSYTIYHTSKL